jgi:[acyl-carrier-protein] S-malonyltransferase
MLAPWIEDPDSRQQLQEWSEAIDLDLIRLGVDADAEEIKDTANAQPLIVAAGLLSFAHLSYAGKFHFVAGHSVGEITAAAIAGVITPLDAMKLVRVRGLEMAKAANASKSGMAAVLGGERDIVLKAIEDAGLVAANDNGGGQIVAAGNLEALASLAPEGARVRPLAVAGAFHTSYMQSAVEPMRTLAASIDVHEASVGVLSNKDGAIVTNGREILDRIVDQIANPVRWDLCMQTLTNVKVNKVVEVAPAGTLVGLIKRAVPAIAQSALKSPADIAAVQEFIVEN